MDDLCVLVSFIIRLHQWRFIYQFKRHSIRSFLLRRSQSTRSMLSNVHLDFFSPHFSCWRRCIIHNMTHSQCSAIECDFIGSTSTRENIHAQSNEFMYYKIAHPFEWIPHFLAKWIVYTVYDSTVRTVCVCANELKTILFSLLIILLGEHMMNANKKKKETDEGKKDRNERTKKEIQMPMKQNVNCTAGGRCRRSIYEEIVQCMAQYAFVRHKLKRIHSQRRFSFSFLRFFFQL